MKICMPVPEVMGMDSAVFGHFGSAPFFAVYDTDKKDVSFVDNNESQHEHGQCMPVNALRNLGIDAVLCKGMGMRAANLLIEAGIKPYMVDAETILDALKCYEANSVTGLNPGNACQHHDCH